MTLDLIKSRIRTIPNWPKPGIMFRDITTLFQDGKAFRYAIETMAENYRNKNIDLIAGIESRGFIVGSALAYELGNLGFISLRKPGKLPGEKIFEEYALEYGTDRLEMHTDAITRGHNVLVVDDLLATGGTAHAACKLVEKLEGKIAGCCFIVDLPDLGGKKKLQSHGYEVFNLVQFEGE